MTHLYLFASITMALQLSNAVFGDYFKHLERFLCPFENCKIFDFLAIFPLGWLGLLDPRKHDFESCFSTFTQNATVMTHLYLFASITMALQLSNAVFGDYFEHLERFLCPFENCKIFDFFGHFGCISAPRPKRPLLRPFFHFPCV